MEKIVWDDSYSVGVKSIDFQHKKLIDMINSLIDANELKVDSEVISDTLLQITDYADYHFKAEEKLMSEAGYPNLPEHRKEHVFFKKKTVSLLVDTFEAKDSVPEDLLRFLKEWLIDHILKTDMQYKEFFKEKGIS